MLSLSIEWEPREARLYSIQFSNMWWKIMLPIVKWFFFFYHRTTLASRLQTNSLKFQFLQFNFHIEKSFFFLRKITKSEGENNYLTFMYICAEISNNSNNNKILTYLSNAGFIRCIYKNWRIVVNIWHTNDNRNVSISTRRWFNCARNLRNREIEKKNDSEKWVDTIKLIFDLSKSESITNFKPSSNLAI